MKNIMPTFPKTVVLLRDSNLNVLNKTEYNKSITEWLDFTPKIIVWANEIMEDFLHDNIRNSLQS